MELCKQTVLPPNRRHMSSKRGSGLKWDQERTHHEAFRRSPVRIQNLWPTRKYTQEKQKTLHFFSGNNMGYGLKC